MASTSAAASAANRFGLGARAGTLQTMRDPREFLLAQLHPHHVAAFDALPSSVDYLQREFAYTRERIVQRRARRAAPAMQTGAMSATDDATAIDPEVAAAIASFRDTFGADQRAELAARYRVALTTDRDFVERLVRFWSNHFAISVDKRPAALYAAPMEREAIRPHVLGRFEDMLLAVETHPGMLRYLDNAQSVGEGSTFATRGARRLERRRSGDDAIPKRRFGLNENLAREILELHTLGVDGGYVQDDVRELARAITGWSVASPRDLDADATTTFRFRANAHEAGTRRVLGNRYASEGEAQGRAILRDLAAHPATARHVCGKLARHFVSDAPPRALVERMASAWERSGGALRAVYAAMVGSPEAWAEDARKLKTPDDFVVSALRSTATLPNEQPRALVGLLGRLGHPPFTPRSPAGFADDAVEWSGADAVWKRIQAAQTLAETATGTAPDPMRTAGDVFGPHLDAGTALALRRAESPREGLALLFASPVFQWRS